MPGELNFDGRTVLVVGGSSGIGNAIAQGFRTRGAQVHIWGTRDNAEAYADEAGSDLAGLHYTKVDVSEPGAVGEATVAFDRLDTLVLCQGNVLYKRQEFEMDGFRKVLEVNLMSVMDCAMRFRDMLLASGGDLQIVSSTAAFHATVGNPAYNASKTGAFGLTRTLGKAWAADGIRVNGIAPGLVATKMTAVTAQNARRYEESLAAIPMGRWGTPDDMANVSLFLASPMAGFMTGQTLVVDGGQFL
ncbi:MAG: SDR family oxidoreductase [Sphingomonadales bacterium]|nr:MAG: SDR family oxidoreductase [Sphingomonadales bacterium]